MTRNEWIAALILATTVMVLTAATAYRAGAHGMSDSQASVQDRLEQQQVEISALRSEMRAALASRADLSFQGKSQPSGVGNGVVSRHAGPTRSPAQDRIDPEQHKAETLRGKLAEFGSEVRDPGWASRTETSVMESLENAIRNADSDVGPRDVQCRRSSCLISMVLPPDAAGSALSDILLLEIGDRLPNANVLPIAGLDGSTRLTIVASK